MGSWAYVRPRIETALAKSSSHTLSGVKYIGRPPAAATATGDKYEHISQHSAMLDAAFA